MAAGRILFTWVDSKGVAGELLFSDAILSDNVVSPMDVTTYPVEEGIPITDNVRPLPQEFSFDVYVSSLPLDIEGSSVQTLSVNIPKPPGGGIFGATSPQISQVDTYTPPPGDLVLRVLDTLDRLQGRVNGEPPITIAIATTKKAYQGTFVVKSYTQRRTKDEGRGAAYTIDVTEIQRASVKVVPTPKPTAIRANTKKKKGTQDPKPVAPVKKATVALKLAQQFGGEDILQ